MLRKLKAPIYRAVRRVSEDATRGPIAAEVGDSKRLLAEYIDVRITPVADAIGRIEARSGDAQIAQIAEIQREALTYVSAELRHVHEALDRVAPPGIGNVVAQVSAGDPTRIDAEHAALLNVAQSHTGPLASLGLYLNPPVQTAWFAGGARLDRVTERIAEVPYVMRAMAGIPAGGRVLDIGCAESTLALTLASLGYDVTAVDPRGYPFTHPQLTILRQRIDEVRPEDHEPFDAVVSLSAIEHFGLASYDGDVRADDADRLTVDRVGELLAPGGRFVITAPYGSPQVTPLERVYGPDEFAALLEGWEVGDRVVLHRADDVTWLPGEDLSAPGCVMAVAVRPAG